MGALAARIRMLAADGAAVVPGACRQGKAGAVAANHQHRQAHAEQPQRALTGIADYREDFYYREAFSLV
jgi:hypothetical protein